MKITKDMLISEIVNKKPESIDILMDFGMLCVGCPAAQAESLEQAAMVHGINVDKLVEALNK